MNAEAAQINFVSRPSDTRLLLLGKGWFPDEPGGLNRYFRDLYFALQESGSSVEAAVVGPASVPPRGVQVLEPSTAVSRRIWRITRQVRHVNPTLVDAHFPLYAVSPAYLGRLRALPWVIHFHGPWRAEARAMGTESRPRIFAKFLAERALFRRAQRFVTLSRAFKSLLEHDYGVDAERIDVIPPGVDLGRFVPGEKGGARRRLGLPEDVLLAVTVRRLVPRMGLSVLLEAWSRVPVDKRLLFIVGDGPEKVALEQQASALGVANRVRFGGVVPDEGVVAMYQAADVAVLPTVSLEGFGLSGLEALACGTPVVVSNVGGLPELVEDFSPDTIVPANAPDLLARRLTQPLPTRAACRHYAERFSWSRALNMHLRTYESAIEAWERLRRSRTPGGVV